LLFHINTTKTVPA